MRAGAKPLDEIRRGAIPNFEHLFSAITRELCKRVNERLIVITKRFDIVEVILGKLRVTGAIGIATLLVPKGANLAFDSFIRGSLDRAQSFQGVMTVVLLLNVNCRYCGH